MGAARVSTSYSIGRFTEGLLQFRDPEVQVAASCWAIVNFPVG